MFISMKICTVCKKSKNVSSFNKDRSKKSGLHPRCKKCDNEYTKSYIKTEKSIEYRRKYHREYAKTYVRPDSWRKKRVAYNIRYQKIRIAKDPEFKLSIRLRTRLYKAIKRNSLVGSAVGDLGCTVSELKLHLEKQFQPGMTWDNWSILGWHIDHKIPLCKFNLLNRKQFLKAVHYTNLQPLWASDNLKKGSNKP